MKIVLGAAAIALASLASAAHAATLDFNFSFQDNTFGGGFVTGIVRGLTDNATGAASSVEVLSNTAGFGLGEFVGNPTSNSFTVSNGAVSSFVFFASGLSNSAPAVTDASLILRARDPDDDAGLSRAQGFFTPSAPTDVVFTPVAIAAAVPLPASVLLLLGAVAGLLGLGRGRRSEV